MTLVVKEVRFQKPQGISEEDAQAEGCVVGTVSGHAFESVAALRLGCSVWRCARDWYADLWDSLHGTGGWDADPEVVALTFSVHRCNIVALAQTG